MPEGLSPRHDKLANRIGEQRKTYGQIAAEALTEQLKARARGNKVGEKVAGAFARKTEKSHARTERDATRHYRGHEADYRAQALAEAQAAGKQVDQMQSGDISPRIERTPSTKLATDHEKALGNDMDGLTQLASEVNGIASFEEAARELGINPNTLKDPTQIKDERDRAQSAAAAREVIEVQGATVEPQNPPRQEDAIASLNEPASHWRGETSPEDNPYDTELDRAGHAAMARQAIKNPGATPEQFDAQNQAYHDALTAAASMDEITQINHQYGNPDPDRPPTQRIVAGIGETVFGVSGGNIIMHGPDGEVTSKIAGPAVLKLGPNQPEPAGTSGSHRGDGHVNYATGTEIPSPDEADKSKRLLGPPHLRHYKEAMYNARTPEQQEAALAQYRTPGEEPRMEDGTRRYIGRTIHAHPTYDDLDDSRSETVQYRDAANRIIAQAMQDATFKRQFLRKKELGRDYSEQGIAEAMAATALPYIERAQKAEAKGRTERAEAYRQAGSDQANGTGRGMVWKERADELTRAGVEVSYGPQLIKHRVTKRQPNALGYRRLTERLGLSLDALRKRS
jgi:hypothetical protein